jgi:hypothetical protein
MNYRVFSKIIAQIVNKNQSTRNVSLKVCFILMA